MIAKNVCSESYNNFHNKIGRPLSHNTNCIDCDEVLILGINARETRRESGRPRKRCTRCDYERRYVPVIRRKHADDNHVVKQSFVNKIGCRASFRKPIPYTKPVDGVDLPRQYFDYKDLECNECNGLIRYQSSGDIVCMNCGLVVGSFNNALEETDEYNYQDQGVMPPGEYNDESDFSRDWFDTIYEEK